MNAVLAIWNDCKPGREAVYEAWYREEHLIERMSVRGFEVGRRYVAIDAPQTYLTTYEVAQVQVLRSSQYLERLQNPTPRTRDIMQNGFENMSRTVCHRTRHDGVVRGVFAVTAVWTAPVDQDPLFATIRACPEVLHSERWICAESSTETAATEERLRGRDAKIAACLLVEFATEPGARAGLAQLRQAAPDATVGLYRKMCELRQGDLL
ncbi:MAG: hypothetical protein AAGA28_13475 [Pseudomonadota bacterium]